MGYQWLILSAKISTIGKDSISNLSNCMNSYEINYYAGTLLLQVNGIWGVS